jgi:alkylglycerol monooxygenase
MIFLEAIVSVIRKAPAYNLEEAVCSISLGLVQQTSNLFLRYFAALPYAYIYNHWRLFDVPSDSIWTFIAMLFLMDFGYYWMHRSAHEFHIMWLGHSVHHSGDPCQIQIKHMYLTPFSFRRVLQSGNSFAPRFNTGGIL